MHPHFHKFATLLFLVFFLPQASFPQVNVTRYQKDFYVLGATQIPGKLTATKDSGVCFISHVQQGSGPNPLSYAKLTRLDKLGNMVWTKGYTASTDSAISISSIESTRDNGLIIAGCCAVNYQSFSNYYNPVLIKIDASGNPVWCKKYPALNGMILTAKELSDSSIIVMLGYYTSSLWNPVLQKVDKNGTVIWSKKVKDWGFVTEKSNQHILLVSGSISLREFDKNGNDIWEKKYTNTNKMIGSWGIDVNANNEIVIFGDVIDSLGYGAWHKLVMKTNPSGNVLFSNLYASSANMVDRAYSGGFSNDCSGIYLNTVYTNFKHGIQKLDLQGNFLWSKYYDTSKKWWSLYTVNTPDHGYASLCQGYYGNPQFAKLIKTDRDGNTSCNNDTSVVFNKTIFPLVVDSTLFSSVVVNLTNTSVAMVSYSPVLNIAMQCVDQIYQPPIPGCNPFPTTTGNLDPSQEALVLYPNPGQNIFTLNLCGSCKELNIEIFNSIGELVLITKVTSNENKFDLSRFPSGIYSLKVPGRPATKFIKD
jgi:hypothetical protein